MMVVTAPLCGIHAWTGNVQFHSCAHASSVLIEPRRGSVARGGGGLVGCCGGRRVLIGCCGARDQMGLFARFWVSNALNGKVV